MRISIVIAAHNEGDRLWKTVQACEETCAALDHEIVVADDASRDGSIDEAVRRFPRVRVVRHTTRMGASPTKALGAQHAQGDVLVFLDGHCNPEREAIARLVRDIVDLDGKAIVTPAIPALDAERWKNVGSQTGHGYRLDLERFGCGWLELGDLRPFPDSHRKLYESPALIGCALAVSRDTYEALWGFDPHMLYWGVEDLDFGLKAWLLGYPVLHDPEAVIGHRFRKTFDNYVVPVDQLIANQLRMARKQFTFGVWSQWVDQCRQLHAGRLTDHPEGVWARAWSLFEKYQDSADRERAHLHSRRIRDEFWYATRFGLAWPNLHGSTAALSPSPSVSTLLLEGSPSPSPSPTPCSRCSLQRNGTALTGANQTLLPGEKNVFSIVCPVGAITDVQWSVEGVIFKNWTGTVDLGKLFKIEEADLKANPLTLYWADWADGRKISATFKLDGKECKVEGTVDVKPITVEFNSDPPTMSDVAITPGQTAVGIEEILLGSKVRQTYIPPSGKGNFLYTQVVKDGDRRWKLANGNCEGVKFTGIVFDKATYPFSGPAPTNPPFYSPTQDAPKTGLPMDAVLVSCKDGYYETTVMFVSSTPESLAIPLYKNRWNWNACVDRPNTSVAWTLRSSGKTNPKWERTTVHPEWVGKIDDHPSGATDCPAPCTN